jgi:hypothetical protein
VQRSTRGPALRRLRREDDGQLLILVLGYTVIAALLVTVVVNVSQAYLYRRSLLAAADGAALAAANAPDLAAVYRDATGPGPGALLPLSRSGARAAVARYAADARLAERFPGFAVSAVATDGATVSVRLRATVPLPLLNRLSDRYATGYAVGATANARSPLIP